MCALYVNEINCVVLGFLDRNNVEMMQLVNRRFNQLVSKEEPKLQLRNVSVGFIMVVPSLGSVMVFNADNVSDTSYRVMFHRELFEEIRQLPKFLDMSYITIPLNKNVANCWTKSLKTLFFGKLFIDQAFNSSVNGGKHLETVMQTFKSHVGGNIPVGSLFLDRGGIGISYDIAEKYVNQAEINLHFWGFMGGLAKALRKEIVGIINEYIACIEKENYIDSLFLTRKRRRYI